MTAARILAVVAALALSAGASAGGVAASAASGETTSSVDLLVSSDGSHFSPALARGLFDLSGLLVPGDIVAADLWIKNPTSAPAVVRVSAQHVMVSSSEIANGVTLSAWDSGTDATRSATMRDIAECQIMVPSQTIAAGATIKVIVKYAMADLTGAVAQNASTSLGLKVAMRDAQAGPFPQSACEDDGVLISSHPVRPSSVARPALAHTGTDFAVPFLAAGGFLVGVGVFFFVAGRRRRQDES